MLEKFFCALQKFHHMVFSPLKVKLPNIKNELIKKLNAKRFLKHIIKVNDVSALRYTIIKLKSEEYKV